MSDVIPYPGHAYNINMNANDFTMSRPNYIKIENDNNGEDYGIVYLSDAERDVKDEHLNPTPTRSSGSLRMLMTNV